jgi:hypothetical protein
LRRDLRAEQPEETAERAHNDEAGHGERPRLGKPRKALDGAGEAAQSDSDQDRAEHQQKHVA